MLRRHPCFVGRPYRITFKREGGEYMSLDKLITDMVDAAYNYPGIDLILYRTMVESVVSVVSTFVGIVAVALVIGLPIVLAIELVFINFPPATSLLTDSENFHNEAGVEKKNRHWGLFVNDARKALRIHAETGVSVNKCYFDVKWLTFATVGLSIALLFSGQDTIVRIVTKLISPILMRIASS